MNAVDLKHNKAVRRLYKNMLLSQKRYVETQEINQELTEEQLQDFAEMVSVEFIRTFYVNDTYDLETFEALIDLKYERERERWITN